MTRNPAQVHPIHVQSQRFAADFVGIALLFGNRCVFVTTLLALVALATRFRSTDFDLSARMVAVRTGYHFPIFTLSRLLATPNPFKLFSMQ
jgi:hypothetical protein